MLFGFKQNKCKQEVYSKDEIDAKYGTGIEEETTKYQVIAKGFNEDNTINESSATNGFIYFCKRNGMVRAHFQILPTQTENHTLAIFNTDGTVFQIPEKYEVLGSHPIRILGINNVIWKASFQENYSISNGEDLAFEGAAVTYTKILNDSQLVSGRFEFGGQEIYMAKNP